MTQIAWKDGHPIMVNGGIGEAPGCCCGGECCCLAASINGETGTDDGTSNWTWNIGPASKTSITGWWEGPAIQEGAEERVEFSASCVGGQWSGTVTSFFDLYSGFTGEPSGCRCQKTTAFTVACDGTITYGDVTSGPTSVLTECPDVDEDGLPDIDPCDLNTYLAFTPATCCVCQSLTLAAERTLVLTFDKNTLESGCTSPTLEIPFSSLATCVNGLLVFETDFDGYLCDPDAGNTIYCATLTVYFSVDPGCNCDTEADCNLTIEAWESSCPGRLINVALAP